MTCALGEMCAAAPVEEDGQGLHGGGVADEQRDEEEVPGWVCGCGWGVMKSEGGGGC